MQITMYPGYVPCIYVRLRPLAQHLCAATWRRKKLGSAKDMVILCCYNTVLILLKNDLELEQGKHFYGELGTPLPKNMLGVPKEMQLHLIQSGFISLVALRQEKLAIASCKSRDMFNQRSEVLNSCRHKRTWLLYNLRIGFQDLKKIKVRFFILFILFSIFIYLFIYFMYILSQVGFW